MITKVYNYLPEEAKEIRTNVFVKEQGFIEEFDEIDGLAKHIVLFDKGQAIATCRTYYHNEKKSYVVGRIAVVKECRGKNIGTSMLHAAEGIVREDGAESIMLSAQMRVLEFYEKQGYIKQGDPYLDEECLHIWMKKNLNNTEYI